ncbi:MAG: NUDIX domain-containing protein [Chloroflexota bacterium]|nr:NUDIX domain-containing protein [Chloroflexota bacterium]
MTRYIDINGDLHERPADAPVQWRIGGYGVIERDGQLLMVEPIWASGWSWNLPGGGIELDPEETILDGIVREVFEETGYRFSPDPDTLAPLGDAFFRTPSGNYWRSVTFTVRGNVGDHPAYDWLQPDDEIVRVAWVNPATLRKNDVHWFHWDVLVKLGYIPTIS